MINRRIEREDASIDESGRGVFPLPPSCHRRRRRRCRSIESQVKKAAVHGARTEQKAPRREEASIVCSLWREDRRGADGFIHQVISGWTHEREREERRAKENKRRLAK